MTLSSSHKCCTSASYSCSLGNMISISPNPHSAWLTTHASALSHPVEVDPFVTAWLAGQYHTTPQGWPGLADGKAVPYKIGYLSINPNYNQLPHDEQNRGMPHTSSITQSLTSKFGCPSCCTFMVRSSLTGMMGMRMCGGKCRRAWSCVNLE